MEQRDDSFTKLLLAVHVAADPAGSAVKRIQKNQQFQVQ